MLSQSPNDVKTAQVASDIFRHQYIVLMLIIISFVVGAFTNPRINKAAPLPKIEARLRLPVSAPIKNVGGIAYSGLFKPRTTELDGDIAEALASVLNQHDLSATFHLAAGGNDILATLRSAKLFQYFEAKGVPLSALTVVVDSENEEDTVLVNFGDAY